MVDIRVATALKMDLPQDMCTEIYLNQLAKAFSTSLSPPV
jgi:hypothetical protein